MRLPPFIARGLQPLIEALWVFFLVWSALVAALWLGAENAVATIPNDGLRAAAMAIVRASDTLWLILGAANVYLHLAEKEGLTSARWIAVGIGASAGGIAACSAWTGYPLGTVFYTTRLGLKLGPVPLGWPLLWFLVVIGGRELAGRVFPRARHEIIAVLTAAIAALTALNLDPLATQLRLYWFWYTAGTHLPSPSLARGYATWFLAAGLLAWVIRGRRVASVEPSTWRPSGVLVVVNVIFLLGHLRLAMTR